jgi:acyl carrier protein
MGGRQVGMARQRLIGLVEQILGQRFDSEFPVEQRLSELGMSSIKMVNLMLAVESEFNILIPQSDITPENFESVAAIEALVVRLATVAASA